MPYLHGCGGRPNMTGTERSDSRTTLPEFEDAEIKMLQAAQRNGGASVSIWGDDRPTGGVVFAYAGSHHRAVYVDIARILRRHGIEFQGRLTVEGDRDGR